VRRRALALVLFAMTAAATPLGRDAAIAFAHEIRDRVGNGDMQVLWPRFDTHMQAALQDSTAYAATCARIHAQLGAIDSLLREEVEESDSSFLVRSRCRFAKLPIPVVVTIDIARDGQIRGLLVKPDTGEPKEYPSAYLDYRDTTRFTLPFRGEWLVFWGGRTLSQNYHASVRSQRFANDILQMRAGSSHRGDGRALTDYYCYGQPILAPADGRVVEAVDSLPDQPIGSQDRSHPAGNHVVIDHGHNEFTLLAHLQPRSVRVRAGDRVRRGQELGLVGNSGNTTEPHLHIHLMNGPDMRAADGLPLAFTDAVINDQPVERAELLRMQRVRPRH